MEPGFSCQLHVYLQGSLRFLCQRLWAVQPTTSPAPLGLPRSCAGGRRPPLPRGLSSCDPLFHKPHSPRRSSGTSWKPGQGPQE